MARTTSKRMILDDESWLQEIDHWAGDLMASESLALRIEIRPSGRRGVFYVAAHAGNVVDGRWSGTVIKEVGSFPNSTATTLAAYLYQLVTYLAIRLEEARNGGLGI